MLKTEYFYLLKNEYLNLSLFQVVQEEGGMAIVSRERKWSRIGTRMGYPPGRGVGSLLKLHYEKILYPYDVFQTGASLDIVRNFNQMLQ